jgi:hypothetical protein
VHSEVGPISAYELPAKEIRSERERRNEENNKFNEIFQ